MKKILITYQIPENGIKLLKKNFDVDLNTNEKQLSREYLLNNISKYDAAITMLYDKIDQKILEKGHPKLKIIANYAVGYNNIDIKKADELDITVCNTPGVLTNATAEIAFSLMISISRNILPADKFVRNGKFVGWRPELFLGDELKNKTVGIFGMGRIGKSLAKKCKCFDMNIIYNNKEKLPQEIEKKYHANYVSFDELLEKSDIISIHAPLSDKTKHLFNKSSFEKMKNGAYIVNTGRGPIIKESDLVDYLQNGRLKGAGLDVYEFEPEVNEKLLKMNNVVLLPHIGSASNYARKSMSEMVANAVIKYFNSKEPENKVV